LLITKDTLKVFLAILYTLLFAVLCRSLNKQGEVLPKFGGLGAFGTFGSTLYLPKDSFVTCKAVIHCYKDPKPLLKKDLKTLKRALVTGLIK
jgi:hypothetical protein